MHKKATIRILLFGIIFTIYSNAVSAQDNACLLEGSFTLMGTTTHIKDCLQNNGVPQENFTKLCNNLANVTAGFPGGKAGTVTYMKSCPANPQGVCSGFFGQPMDSYYYNRDPKLLAETKQSCLKQGSKWK